VRCATEGRARTGHIRHLEIVLVLSASSCAVGPITIRDLSTVRQQAKPVLANSVPCKPSSVGQSPTRNPRVRVRVQPQPLWAFCPWQSMRDTSHRVGSALPSDVADGFRRSNEGHRPLRGNSTSGRRELPSAISHLKSTDFSCTKLLRLLHRLTSGLTSVIYSSLRSACMLPSSQSRSDSALSNPR
jgi:hypothetical protein